MRLLAIETSGTIGTVALASEAEVIERAVTEPREQTARILPIVDELLGAAGLELRRLDAIVLGRGPGSFTGLRVAAAVAQGFGLAAGVPIVSVSSMAGLAQRAWAEAAIEHALVCIDARMGEVYWGEYAVTNGVAAASGEERISAPADVSAPRGRSWAAIGNGFGACGDALAPVSREARSVHPELAVRARDLLPQGRADAGAGRFVDPVDALPAYLRESNAWRRQ